MTSQIPKPLADWRGSPRVRALNEIPVATASRYVLCWLQQALRASDKPVIDAAVVLGNLLGLPVLIYHGVRENYPFASVRLRSFILGALRDLERDCAARRIGIISGGPVDGLR